MWTSAIKWRRQVLSLAGDASKDSVKNFRDKIVLMVSNLVKIPSVSLV